MPSSLVLRRDLARRVAAVLLIALLLLGGLGFGVDRTILAQERAAVTATLEALLAISTRSVVGWLDDRRTVLTLVSRSKRVQRAVGEALAAPASVTGLRDLLGAFSEPFQLANAMLTDSRGTVLAGVQNPAMKGRVLPATALPYLTKAWSQGPCVTPPMLVDLGGGEEPQMLAVTTVPREDGQPAAAIVFTIDPAVFTAQLDETRPGDSGEIEAFDREGRMISQSRFLEQIVAAGVLPSGTRSTVLTLDLRNPGVDIRTGKRSSLPVRAQPLSAMVACAVQGQSGVDVDGYLDYRGVKSVAAWTWIAPYDFGLAVKMDYAEAFSTTRTLRIVLLTLVGMLVAAVGALVGWYYFHLRTLRRLAEAQSRVEKLGQYQLERKLGEGGMGEVYLGHHVMLRRATAIKLLRDTSTEDDRKRFEREVQLGCRLTHPNTIAIFDYGHTVDGRFYYAMEYLDGIDLAKVVERHGPLPAGRVVQLLAQACASLAEAHELNLIHRDVKPENIMVCNRGGVPDLVKVLDFGLVKSLEAGSPRVTASATICGTPAFIAPEVILGHAVDARSDLYSLAGVGYYLLTGRLLHERASVMDTLMAQVNERPAPIGELRPDVPADLIAVLTRGLSKRPAERPSDARAMRTELLACACAADWGEVQARAWWAEISVGEPQAPAASEGRALQIAASRS